MSLDLLTSIQRSPAVNMEFAGEFSVELDQIGIPLLSGGVVTDPETWLKRVEEAEALMLHTPQSETPVTHRFAPGQYMREVVIPAGTFAIGHAHTEACFDVVLEGKARVVMNGEVKEITAPAVFVSQPFQRKVGVILETVRWLTIHPTSETDLGKLEDLLTVKSESFLRYKQETSPEKLARDHADYRQAIARLGYTHEEVRAITEDTSDQICAPDCLTNVCFLPSEIDGLGMFAKLFIPAEGRIAIARVGGKRTMAGRYTNHSFKPNAVARMLYDGGVEYIAAEDIFIGSEITLDYRQARQETLPHLP